MGKILGYVNIGKKGQITIPHKVRKYLKVDEGDSIILLLDNNKIIIEPGDKEIEV